MPPLIDPPRIPIRFATPITPVGSSQGIFRLADTLEKLTPIRQRQAELKARVAQQEANRAQRDRFAIQEQLGDVFSDLQGSAARRQQIEAIGERQQALENLRTQNDLQINADKFYLKNYGKSLDQVQREAQQAGMPLEEYNHVLNGEQFILPPENIAAIEAIDQSLQAIKLDENLGPEDSLEQVMKLNDKRFKLTKKEWRFPKSKPITFQQALDSGMAMELPPGFGLMMITGFANDRPKWTHIKPPDPDDAQQRPVSIGGTPIPSTILDADDIARERKKVFDSRKRSDKSTSQRAIDEEVLEGIRKSRPAEMRILDAIEDITARRRAPGDRVLKTGAMVRAENQARKRISELNAIALSATKKQKRTPEFQKLLDELEQLMRFIDAGR